MTEFFFPVTLKKSMTEFLTSQSRIWIRTRIWGVIKKPNPDSGTNQNGLDLQSCVFPKRRVPLLYFGLQYFITEFIPFFVT
jgi:hypothetical protein